MQTVRATRKQSRFLSVLKTIHPKENKITTSTGAAASKKQVKQQIKLTNDRGDDARALMAAQIKVIKLLLALRATRLSLPGFLLGFSPFGDGGGYDVDRSRV